MKNIKTKYILILILVLLLDNWLDLLTILLNNIETLNNFLTEYWNNNLEPSIHDKIENNSSNKILENTNIDDNKDILKPKPFYKSKEFLIASGVLILILGVGVLYMYNLPPTEINNSTVNNTVINNPITNKILEDLENFKYYLGEMDKKYDGIEERLESISNREDNLISDIGKIVDVPW